MCCVNGDVFMVIVMVIRIVKNEGRDVERSITVLSYFKPANGDVLMMTVMVIRIVKMKVEM